MQENHIVIWQDDCNDLHVENFKTKKEADYFVEVCAHKCVGVSGHDLTINDEMSC